EEKGSVSSDVIYRVTALKSFFDQQPSSSVKLNLLNAPVSSCNYKTSTTLFNCCNGGKRKIRKIFLVQVPSCLTIGEHFNLLDLTDECEIGISAAEHSEITRLIDNNFAS